MSDSNDKPTALDPTEPPSEDPEPPDRLTVALVREDGDWNGFGPIEKAVAQAANALADNPRVELPWGSQAALVLGNDALVRRLNCTYRGIDASTNVLSFPFQRPPGAAEEDSFYLGDVVLAAETVAREAVDRRIEPRHHLQHLVVHGLLHLLGHDHAADEQATAMERIETEVLETIGVADPYAAAAR